MRGLLMIEPLYHQTIRGCKTQTRRSGGLDQVNGRKATKDKPAIITDPDKWMKIGHTTYIGGKNYPNEFQTSVNFVPAGLGLVDSVRITPVECKPRYRMCEVLYLKEPTALIVNTASEKEFLLYKFNTAESDRRNIRWSNKLFMPETDARAFIKITGIRCERLLDIKGQDCIAEGVETTGLISKAYNAKNENRWFTTDSHLKDSFLSLYKFANKVKEVPNLWIWVYEFEYLPNYKA